MGTTANPSKTVFRSRQRSKVKQMNKAEMVKKMLADQKFVREAIQNGVSFKELREKYGYKFATV